METTGTIIHAPFTEFIASFKKKLRGIFHVQDEIDRLTRERGFPEGGLNEVMSANPFAVAIPARYGGRGSVAGEALGLLGANGYKSESIASRGIIDSRPFRIFEGSNEMLYTQITEMVLKLMGNIKRANLSDFLKQYHLTDSVAGYFKSLTDFIPDIKMPQRKQVSLGKIISRIIAANHVVKLGERGFRNDLVTGSLETIKHEVTTLVSSFSFKGRVVPVGEHNDGGSWLEYC